MKYKIYKLVCFLVGNKKVEKVESRTDMNAVEKYTSEFDNRFGFILKHELSSREEYEETKSYYVFIQLSRL
ncbi:MAG: hypothetical protein WCT77_11565 [Bacteroidota bacterium]